jgi:hypothetical protein
MGLEQLRDESVLHFYENIRGQVAADLAAENRYRLLGEAAKQRADHLREEIRRLRYNSIGGFDGTRWATRGKNLCFSERPTLPPISEEKTFFRSLAASAPPCRGRLAIDNAEKFAH